LQGHCNINLYSSGRSRAFDGGAGNEAIIHSRGAMDESINGIIHDENLNYDSQTESKFVIRVFNSG